MQHLQIQQNSPEWWAYKVGKISGTRFGQVISSRENMLIDELANEILEGAIYPNDLVTDDMQFGIDNEPIALDLYQAVSGLRLDRGGVIQSENHTYHMASPDAICLERGIVVEVKCTRSGAKQINRFRNGIDSAYIPQIVNYFAVSPDVNEVHFVSYCPFRPERELVVIIVKRDTEVERKETKVRGLEITTVQDKVNTGLAELPALYAKVNQVVSEFKQSKF